MKKCREFRVFGRVQGVGFRRFIQAKVDSMNQPSELISGHICNLEDGSVRVVAQAEVQMLDKLEQLLKIGTIRSVVERVESTPLENDENLSGFEILRQEK